MPENAYGQIVGVPLEGWSPRPAPSRSPIEGRYCRIEPLEPDRHGPDLFEAFMQAPDGRDWTYLSVERFDDPQAYRNHLRDQAASDDPLHYAIVEPGSGRAIGTEALMRIDRANGVIEIGSITFSRALQRTAAGTEAVYLLMCRVFDELGYRRLEWKCDCLNAVSRRAAVRYGFTFEGIFRQAIVTKGRNRDTAWYAMTDRDWPVARQAFELWLASSNFDAAQRQKRGLAACRAIRGDGV